LKIKDVHVGQSYILSDNKKSRLGCSWMYFDTFKNTKVLVTEKLNNFNNKNTIRIQNLSSKDDTYELVSFWCSPYDLKEIPDSI